MHMECAFLGDTVKGIGLEHGMDKHHNRSTEAQLKIKSDEGYIYYCGDSARHENGMTF